MRRTSFEKFMRVVNRLIQIVLLVFCVIVVTFLLVHMAPGDPAMVLAGEYEAGEEVLNDLRAEFGLDKPLIEQFFIYLAKIIQLDFGYSYRYRSPVLGLILSRLPNTLLLIGISFALSLVIGVILAAFCALKPNSALDTIVSGISMIGYCLPVFWLGMILILIFSLKLNLLPSGGFYSFKSGVAPSLDIKSLILPTITYSANLLAVSFRLTRSKMIDALKEDYVTTARSKGLSTKEVLFKHALRNSIVPVISVMGLNFGVMLGGSVTIETIFSWSGVGRLMYDSILSRDYPLLMGIFILVSVGVIIADTIADLIAMYLDPRMSYTAEKA